MKFGLLVFLFLPLPDLAREPIIIQPHDFQRTLQGMEDRSCERVLLTEKRLLPKMTAMKIDTGFDTFDAFKPVFECRSFWHRSNPAKDGAHHWEELMHPTREGTPPKLGVVLAFRSLIPRGRGTGAKGKSRSDLFGSLRLKILRGYRPEY